MFIGRKQELKILNELYNNDNFECLVITGRRRIGKSTLLNQFFKDKKGIYFSAIEGNSTLNLEILNVCISDFEKEISNRPLLTESKEFNSFYQALESIFKLSLKIKFVFIIDEFPFLVKADRSIASILQHLIDKYKDNSKMMLILSGSSVSFMENEVLGYKAPLFGRKTAQIKLEPLNFSDSLTYLKNRSNEEKILFYSAYGGTPYYLNQIKMDLNFQENIKGTFLRKDNYLFNEPVNLLKQEVQELSSINSILTAIAGGSTKLSEISTKVHLNSSTTSRFTKILIELGFVKKEYPYNEETNKKTLYRIKDNFFKFWFKFIPKNNSLIIRDLNDEAYNHIEPFLNNYIGQVFEDISKEYLWELRKKQKSPIAFYSLGRWWGTDSKLKKQVEIDIVGEKDNEEALFAECKWTNEKADSKTLKNLIKKSSLFPHLIKHYFIFSKSGFTSGLIQLAKEIPNVYLVDLDEMITEFESE